VELGEGGIDRGRWMAGERTSVCARRCAGDALPPDVQALIKTRSKARDERDWPAADAARSALADLGWDVTDGPDGPVLTPRTD